MKQSADKNDLTQREDVRAKIQERAYHIAESEGFPHGRDFLHWIQAEEEIIARHLKEMTGAVRDAVVRATSKGRATDGKVTAAPSASPAKAASAKAAKSKTTAAKPASAKAPAAKAPAAKAPTTKAKAPATKAAESAPNPAKKKS